MKQLVCIFVFGMLTTTSVSATENAKKNPFEKPRQYSQYTTTIKCPAGQYRLNCDDAWKCCTKAGGKCLNGFPSCD